MAVLAIREIQRRMRLTISKPESLVITPLLERKRVLDSDSVDLRLGSYFLLPKLQEPFFCPDEKSSKLVQARVHIPLGKYLVVPAHQTVLGVTLEFIKLPYDISGQILTKSSVARTFIIVETAPWIHPCYRGCLTLEIANVSNTPVLLYPGRLIAQLILTEVRPKPARKDILQGSYLGPVFPEAPVFDNPKKDLEAIGITSVWTIRPPRND
jgi:dCTP deaminase